MTTHFYLPDCQIRPGDDLKFLTAIGNFIVDKKPDVVICAGDFSDMSSLSSYDIGKKDYEGRRYKKDVEATHSAMVALLTPLWDFNARAKKNKEKQYRPRMVLTIGNHEERINRAINDDPKLEGLISIQDLGYEGYGWEVHPFLDVVVVDGVAYSHYFVTGVAGRPASTASALLSKKHMSCIAGHQQGKQIASAYRADGQAITCIIAGSCYEHNEDYMGPQGNNHWRGIVVLHEVNNGSFDEMFVSLDYLKRKHGST